MRTEEGLKSFDLQRERPEKDALFYGLGGVGSLVVNALACLYPLYERFSAEKPKKTHTKEAENACESPSKGGCVDVGWLHFLEKTGRL